MQTKTDNSICTDVEWLGRAHCDKCHIRRLMMFSELPDSAFENLLQPIDHFLYSSGTVIYEAGSQKNFIYSIRRGMVKLAHITHNGDYRIVRLLGPGAVIGLELLDGSDNYHHTAVAIGQVDLCKIPVSTIRQLESSYSGLYEKVVEQLQKQLNLADQWIITLGTGTAKQRVAQLLLILNEFYADKDGDFILLNREDMAAMIGTSTETVSRMIAEFKRENILTKTHNRLHKCNIEALQQITSQRRTLRDPSPQ